MCREGESEVGQERLCRGKGEGGLGWQGGKEKEGVAFEFHHEKAGERGMESVPGTHASENEHTVKYVLK